MNTRAPDKQHRLYFPSRVWNYTTIKANYFLIRDYIFTTKISLLYYYSQGRIKRRGHATPDTLLLILLIHICIDIEIQDVTKNNASGSSREYIVWPLRPFAKGRGGETYVVNISEFIRVLLQCNATSAM